LEDLGCDRKAAQDPCGRYVVVNADYLYLVHVWGLLCGEFVEISLILNL